MPKILKKDIINHIEAFFEKQGKRLSNIKRAKKDELYEIMEKYNIPPIDEDKVNKEKKEEQERKEKERIEWEKEEEEREKEYQEIKKRHKFGDLMRRIINTKLIKDFYKNDKNKFSKWRSYLHRKEIQEYHKSQEYYDSAVILKEYYELDDRHKNSYIQIKSLGKEWCVDVNGMNVYQTLCNRRQYGDIDEPYKKQEDISNELNPFKETDWKELD